MKKAWKMMMVIALSGLMGFGGSILVAVLLGFPVPENGFQVVGGGAIATLLIALVVINRGVYNCEL